MKRGIKYVFFSISMLLFWGCYPGGPDYIEELDVALSKHNPDYDFTAKATYAMPDSIVKITGNLVEGDEPSFIPNVTAQKILAMIADNMAALGWQRVELSANPDLLLAPASWETTTIYYYYDYWYWWYGGYWGGYWGGYYPPVYWSSYTTGTLVMGLIDRAVVGGNGNPVTQWTGAINGILTSSFSESRVRTAIDNVFDQSPYLKTN
jgi:hypothetical protein